MNNYLLFYIIISYFLLNKITMAQFTENDYINEFNNKECGTPERTFSIPFFPVDYDTLKMLVVFAQYPDDNWNPNQYDPNAQATLYWQNIGMPYWATGIISPNTLNVGNSNITAYFRDASLGKYWVIGDVYPNIYIFQNSSSYYHPSSGRHIGHAVRELLENLDPYIDFSQYDKFAPYDPFNKRHPDGVVDFILIVFRFFKGTEPATGSGVASLGGTNNNFGNEDFITTDEGLIIYAGYPGSGAISTQLTPWGYNIHCHEFGHYILGGHRNHMGLFNLMNGNGNSFISSDEREFLNWGPSPFIPTSNSTFILQDYGNTGKYIKFTKGNYTYYLENRRRINYHLSNQWTNWPFYTYNPFVSMSPDSSLLIHRYYNSIESANGKWQWKVSTQYPTRFIVDSINNGRYVNVFFYDLPNRYFGETIFNLFKKDAVDYYTGQPFFYQKASYAAGGDSNTCFDIGYNQVYSPWSNPGIKINNPSDSFAVEIIGKTTEGNLIVSVFFNNLTETSPSKPQKLTASRQYISYPPNAFRTRLDWYHNLEPDIQKYKIYRGEITIPGIDPVNYSFLGETTDTTFLDQTIILYRGTSGGGTCQYVFKKFAYRISAVDNTNKESVRSEKDSISGYSDPCAPHDSPIQKGNNRDIILKYSLNQNFPNPFNPTTHIKYSIPFDELVRIKIFDILGREVKTIINENKIAGEYIVYFDGSSLASGIYFYKLETNNFICIKKMLLIK